MGSSARASDASKWLDWTVTSMTEVPGLVAAWWTDASCEASVSSEPVFLLIEESTTVDVLGLGRRRTRVSYVDHLLDVRQELRVDEVNYGVVSDATLDPYVFAGFMTRTAYEVLLNTQDGRRREKLRNAFHGVGITSEDEVKSEDEGSEDKEGSEGLE